MKQIIKQIEELIGYEIPKDNKRPSVELRGVIFKLGKKYTPYITLKQLGEPFGKHHATVLHSLNNIDDWMRFNPNLYKIYDLLMPIFTTEYISENQLEINRLNEIILQLETKLKELQYDHTEKTS